MNFQNLLQNVEFIYTVRTYEFYTVVKYKTANI